MRTERLILLSTKIEELITTLDQTREKDVNSHQTKIVEKPL
jgi:hypothetical protein